MGSQAASKSSDAIDMLKSMPWKGNVRELENAIERALILCDCETIRPEHISGGSGTVTEAGLGDPASHNGQGKSLEYTAKLASREAETVRIKQALSQTGGNKSKASELLKVSYKTLLTKIKDYGI